MFTINLQILLVTFTIKVVTYHNTENNIALSLARSIVRIVTENKYNRLQEHKDNLLKIKHLEIIIDYSFIKLFQPRKHKNNGKNVITFARTYNPYHQFYFNKFKKCIKNTTNRELQQAFNDKKILLTTRQPKKLKQKNKNYFSCDSKDFIYILI